ncbi:MAG: potassium-transporting ATPase subunit KdpC [Melioribacteraceae bacterium]
MRKEIYTSIRIFVIISILTGIIYPILITFIGQIIFPFQANGSIIKKENKIIGSLLIGQNFTESIYFHSRPSAIKYNPVPSGASNLGLSNKILKEHVITRKEEFLKYNLFNDSINVPSEMLFASGSGVDPHISNDAAKLQIIRILNSRKINLNNVKILSNIVDSLTEYPQFGILGNQVVNVFALNLKLDEMVRNGKL